MPNSQTIRVGVAALTLVTPLFGAALPFASPAAAAPAALIEGPAQKLLDAIPVLPKMTAGFTTDAYPSVRREAEDSRGCTPQAQALIALATVRPQIAAGTCSLSGGSWQVNFGTATVSNARDIRFAPVVALPAAWASGGYGWSAAQRAAFATDYGADTKAVVTSAAPADSALSTVPWAAAQTPVTAAVASRISDECSQSTSSTCLLTAVPAALKAPAGAAIVLASSRHRLALTRDEKASVANAIDHFTASAPAATFAVTTTDVPALPSTDGSDATGRVIDASLFGILAPPATGSVPNVPYSTLRLWDSGVGWRDIEPTPGRFTWTVLDHAVRSAESSGKKVLLVLGPMPAWASANPESADEGWGRGATGPFTSDGMGAYARYVDQVVRRYGNRISAYEIWNEANLPTFWAGTAAQMAEMTKIVHDAVASRGANSRVISASATTRVEGSIYRFFPAYLKELAKRGWPLDGYAVHAYPDADGTPSETSDFVAQFKAYLAIAGAPTLPIYNTELNYGLAGPGPSKPHRDMTPEQSQGWLSRTFIDSVRLGIAETYWFAWTKQYYGQLGIQLNPTTAATRTAWLTTYSWLVGSTFKSCADPEGAVICEFERDGRPFWLAYADGAKLIDLPAGATQSCDLRGACMMADGTKVIVGVRPIKIN
jgi:hypothetical protein